MAEEKSSVCTVLCTRVEGADRLWSRDRELAADALARPDEIVRQCLEDAGGRVFRRRGHSLAAAFATPAHAVHAAVRAQRALVAEPGGAGLDPRVRMALHSGPCIERDGELLGAVVARAESLAHSAHGGQVVVSESTRDLLEPGDLQDVAFADLGVHRPADLGPAARVFQVEAPGLARTFPALRGLDNPELPNNLPEQTTTFVGRQDALAHLSDLLEQARLVTLVGPGGAGKTRLALQVAAGLLDGSATEVWLVELAPVPDGDLVVTAVASALRVRERPGRALLDTVVDAVGARSTVIVLDNCEHVIASVADLADRILRSCPGVRILATSREPVSIDAEWVFRVPSMAVPPDETVTAALQFDAVQLFVERARQQSGDGSVRDLDLHDVVSVCRRLDGIPLAIELAVVRMRTMSLGEILRKLDDRFDLLTGGSRSAMARQQTLRAAVDWSYDLLNRSEATTLCLLSIFAGGFSGDDAELVGADAVGGPVRFREVLHSLVDKSLVAVDTGAPVTRYRLNDSIRLYAAERLAEQGESVRGAALDAHGRLFLALAEEAAPHLVGGAQQVWLDRLDQEKDNLRLALQYLLAAPGRQVHALRMCVALRRFWFARGYWTEAGELLATALELPGAHAERELRAAVLCAAGQMAGRRSDHVGARALFEEGLELGRELGLDGIEAECLCGIGWAAYSLGDLGTARSVIDHAVEKARTCGNAQVLGMVLERRASINYEDHDACRADYVEALEHLRGAGDLLNIGVVENNMADLELIAARPDRARPHVEAALAISDMLHDESIMYNFLNLGHVEFMSADVDRARTLYVDAFRSARRIGDHFMVANSVLGLALCRTASPDAVAAAELHGVADALMEKSGGTHEVVERALRAQDHATLRATLGDDAFDLAYSSGRSRADRSGAEAALILSP